MDSQIRLVIDRREPFAGAEAFAGVGPYELLSGRVDFAIDPAAAAFSTVVDLEHAPRNTGGLVEYSADIYMLKPTDMERGNRRILYDVNNRGNLRCLQFFNDAVHDNAPSAPEHAGNGFLMRRGYTVVWSGWQGDISPGADRLTMRLPVATLDGEPITGAVRTEFMVDEPGVTALPLSANHYTDSYEAASTDTAVCTFTVRKYEHDPRVPIPADQWRFASIDPDGEPTPSPLWCHLPAGFRPGWLYELIYEAKAPRVLGLGFTGVRDLLAFLRHDAADSDGAPNPLSENGAGIDRVYGWGRSQSGRFLREFVYRGYNEDASGRRVFDAISPHVSGGGRVALNYRFGQPGRFPRQHNDRLYPSDQFPFAYPVTTDAHTGKIDGILKRPETDPLVIHTQTASEYWDRRGSLVHTDSLGNDLPDHDRARVFLFAGSQHNADPLGGPTEGNSRHLSNPLNTTPLLRALLDRLDDWATSGAAPPPSRVPTRRDETGVPADVAQSRFPAIPGAEHPNQANRLYLTDHGPMFDKGIIAGDPPPEDKSREYAVLVSQLDADGNEIAGIRTPHVEAPIATYTGWNYRPDGAAGKAQSGTLGSYLPFAADQAERSRAGDPRPSIRERYPTRASYVRAIAAACETLVRQRLLLEEDADRYVELAMRDRVLD